MNSPVVWSICASISTMARTAVSRMARAGCSSGKSMNWVRISGDALNSSQLTLSPLTAMDDWVLLVALMVPLRRPSQLGQLQFHWGNPPPAAEPSTRIRIARASRFVSSEWMDDQLMGSVGKSPREGAFSYGQSIIRGLSSGNVHGHFEAETHFGILGLSPHGFILHNLK